MTKVVLIRHGRSTANADGVLAGRAEGIALDDVGRGQAEQLRRLLDGVPVAACYRSPIQRCAETATLLGFPDAIVDERLTECDYGAWTNRPLAELATEPLWPTIQATPSEVTFPEGESMLGMRERCVAAVDDIAARHGAEDVVLVVSHGDPIKAILSHALGQPFDAFQRLGVGPASVSVIDRSGERAFVACINAVAEVAAHLRASHAPVVGGGDVAAE